MKYFDKTKESHWNLLDAYNNLGEEHEQKSCQQKLDILYDYIKKAENSKMQQLLQNWKSFYKRVVDRDENLSQNATNIFNTRNDFSNSSKATVNIGTMNHVNKKRKSRDEIDDLFNPEPTSTADSDEQKEEFSLPQLPVSLEDIEPEDYDREVKEELVINKINVIAKWIQYQVCSAAMVSTTGLIVEYDIQKILSLSNIMLIKKNQYCPELEELLGTETIKEIEKIVKNKLNISYEDLDASLTNNLKKILKDYEQDNISCKMASKKITNLTSINDDQPADNIFYSIRNMIERLSKQKYQGDIKERTVCDFVDAVFRPLLEDIDNNVLFNWADMQVIENSSKMPDFVVRKIKNTQFAEPFVIGEVKGENAKHDNYLNLVDLMRIALLSKDAIDNNFFKGVIGVHAVGLYVTVYVTVLVGDGLYVMLEICSIELPRDVSQMRQFVFTCEDLLCLPPLSKICQEKIDNLTTFQSYVKPGIRTPTFKKLIKTSKNRKRMTSFILHR